MLKKKFTHKYGKIVVNKLWSERLKEVSYGTL